MMKSLYMHQCFKYSSVLGVLSLMMVLLLFFQQHYISKGEGAGENACTVLYGQCVLYCLHAIY